MNKANKLTISRIIISFIVIIILLFPFDQMGLEFPKYMIKNNIIVDLKYIVVGILFLIGSLTDFFDGFIARKYNIVTDFGKVLDTIADKLLVNSLLVILACEGKISVIIATIIICRDIFVDSFKLFISWTGKVVSTTKIDKIKTAFIMGGITLVLFYNIPFEIVNLRISDFILVVGVILSVISGFEYYKILEPCIKK